MRPSNAGAETAPLRENCLSRRPGVSPARPSQLGWSTPRRGGLRTPATTPLAPLEHFPGRPPALRLPPGRHAIPGLACGLPTRARRPRPSEKIAFRVIPWPSTARPSQLGLSTPRRGGLRTPGGRLGFDSGMCPLGHRFIVNPSGGNGMLRHPWGRITRTHGVHFSEKIGSRLISRLAPKGRRLRACLFAKQRGLKELFETFPPSDLGNRLFRRGGRRVIRAFTSRGDAP